MNDSFATAIQRANARFWNENITTENATNSEKSDAHCFLGFTRTSTGSYKERATAVIRAYYSVILCESLKPAI
jgi:hypothetical protein